MKKRSFILLLIGACISTTMVCQSIVVEKAGQGGVFARIGNPIGVASNQQINITDSKLETTVGGLFSTPLDPRMILNAYSNYPINIGAYDNPIAALNIAASNNLGLSLDLSAHGRIYSSANITFQLDVDNDEDSYFVIRESINSHDLFWIGENGNHFVNGNLFVDGSVKVENVDTFYKVLQNIEFEIRDDYGDELELGYSFVKGDGADDLTGSSQCIHADVGIGLGSTIHEVEIAYQDRDPEASMDFNIGACGEFELLDTGDDENFSSNTTQIRKFPINIVIEESCDFGIEMMICSRATTLVSTGEWDEQRVYTVRIKYTMP